MGGDQVAKNSGEVAVECVAECHKVRHPIPEYTTEPRNHGRTVPRNVKVGGGVHRRSLVNRRNWNEPHTFKRQPCIGVAAFEKNIKLQAEKYDTKSHNHVSKNEITGRTILSTEGVHKRGKEDGSNWAELYAIKLHQSNSADRVQELQLEKITSEAATTQGQFLEANMEDDNEWDEMPFWKIEEVLNSRLPNHKKRGANLGGDKTRLNDQNVGETSRTNVEKSPEEGTGDYSIWENPYASTTAVSLSNLSIYGVVDEDGTICGEKFNADTPVEVNHHTEGEDFWDEMPFWKIQKEVEFRTQKYHHHSSLANLERDNALQREKIKGATIKVTVSEKYPYIVIGDNNSVEGYVGDLWKTVQDILQFKTEFLMMTNTTEQKRALLDGKGDLMLNPVVPTAQDLDNFNHTLPIANIWYHLYVKEDSNVGSSLYSSAWRPYLWYAFFSTIALLSFMLWMVHVIRWGYGGERSTPLSALGIETTWTANLKGSAGRGSQPQDTDFSIGNCILCVLGAVANQGSQMKVDGCTATRVLNLVNLLFGLVMFTCYSGVLVSKLTVTSPTVNFPTLESIAEANTHSLCVSETSFGYFNFKAKDEDDTVLPQWKSILNRAPCKVGKSDVVPLDDYCSSDTVVLEAPHNKDRVWDRTAPCRTAQLAGKYFYTSLSLLVRKDFNYTYLINTFLLRLQSTGVTTRIRERWFQRKPHENAHDPEYAVAWPHIQHVFYFYCASVAASLALLGLEVLIHRKFTSRFKKTQSVTTI